MTGKRRVRLIIPEIGSSRPENSPRGEVCEAQRESLAPACRRGTVSGSLSRTASYSSAIRRPASAGRMWVGESGTDGKEEAVAPFKIILPFMVRAEIGDARLYLHDPDFPFCPERENVGPAPALERKFRQRSMPQSLQEPHTPRRGLGAGRPLHSTACNADVPGLSSESYQDGPSSRLDCCSLFYETGLKFPGSTKGQNTHAARRPSRQQRRARSAA